MRGRLLSGALVLATVFGAAPLLSQSELTISLNPSTSVTAKLTCPTNTLMIGISAVVIGFAPDASFDSIDRIDCSLYKADGTRFGAPTTLAGTDPPLMPLMRTHLVCPGDKAITMVRTQATSELRIIYAEMFCATVGPNGGQSTSVKAGMFPADMAKTTNGSLTCPGTFAHGVATASNALMCIAAPLIANAVSSVGLAAFHTVAGNSLQGTVTLNGYAVGGVSVGLGVIGAPGAAVPTSLTIPDGARSASFLVQSAFSTAGCGTVTAIFGASVSAPLVITPAPPAGATFSFSILPASSTLMWGAPSTLTAIVAFPSQLKSGIVLSQPTVTITSNQPDVLAIQSSLQRVGSDTVKVTMNALKSGCTVVTATVNGVPYRKTLRLATGL